MSRVPRVGKGKKFQERARPAWFVAADFLKISCNSMKIKRLIAIHGRFGEIFGLGKLVP